MVKSEDCPAKLDKMVNDHKADIHTANQTRATLQKMITQNVKNFNPEAQRNNENHHDLPSFSPK